MNNGRGIGNIVGQGWGKGNNYNNNNQNNNYSSQNNSIYQQQLTNISKQPQQKMSYQTGKNGSNIF